MFADIDTGSDRRIDIREFKAGLRKMGIRMTDREASDAFRKIDRGVLMEGVLAVARFSSMNLLHSVWL